MLTKLPVVFQLCIHLTVHPSEILFLLLKDLIFGLSGFQLNIPIIDNSLLGLIGLSLLRDPWINTINVVNNFAPN